ncbi:hypothetical protein B7494_g3293 [Chlorociboria aeruginascens]|nr:hypothetical protein B7494_g3293 [Chlorociboria aeruginascens]
MSYKMVRGLPKLAAFHRQLISSPTSRSIQTMAFTELVTPAIKQDEASKNFFMTTLAPMLGSIISSAPGLKHNVSGRVIFEDNSDVGSELKPAVGIEWEKEDNLYALLAGEDFKAFGGQAKSYFTRPPQPELYKTDISPVAAFSSAATEVFRIKIEDETKIEKAQQAWESLIATIRKTTPEIEALSGPSLNLKEPLFVGIIGWKGVDARNTALDLPEAAKSKNDLESLDGVTSFIAQFAH